MQRLDDPSSGIRILAASVIPKLEPTFGEEDAKTTGDENQKTVFEHDVWLAFVKHCLNLMFLHYDGPEIRLQEAIKGNTIHCIFSECDSKSGTPAIINLINDPITISLTYPWVKHLILF